MKRRSFIKRTAPVALLPVFINGLSFRSYGNSPLLQLLAAKASINNKVLVLVQLNGGNDGLNTLIPLDQYTNLSNARANIMITESKVPKLKGFDKTGLHPAMTGMLNLFNNESSLNIIQAVGYPSPNFSHFRATDIWLSGSDSSQYMNSGWIGRYLEDAYPGFPTNYPNTDMPDPLAISIGGVVSQALQGPEINMGMAISDPTAFYNFVDSVVNPNPTTPSEKELAYIRLIAQQSDKYSDSIKAAYNSVATKSTMYADTTAKNSLSDQLKIVARLIAGGLKTKIYMVSLGGFDTHSNQVNTTGGTETGAHADLWSKVSVGISAFLDDCKKLGVADRVAGMTYSEFGRRIVSNASFGTDHGAAGPSFVFGTSVNNTLIGANPTIPSTVGAADNVNYQYDFRQIYTSILQQWFGLTKIEAAGVLLKDIDTLPIFKSTTDIKNSEAAIISLVDNYPNPFENSTTIKIQTSGGLTQLKVFDALGNEVATLVNKVLPSGTYEILFEAHNLASGNYYYSIISGSSRANGVMLKK